MLTTIKAIWDWRMQPKRSKQQRKESVPNSFRRDILNDDMVKCRDDFCFLARIYAMINETTAAVM